MTVNPKSLTNLQPTPRKPLKGVRKTALVQMKLIPTDKEKYLAAVTAAGWKSPLELAEAISEGLVEVPKKESAIA